MPRLWNDTIQDHRRAVEQAILDTTWSLVSEHGMLAVTMAQIARRTGIGRATLYNYFPDVESILRAHHDRHVADHLERLEAVAEQPGSPLDRLSAVIREYALIRFHRGQHGPEELTVMLHAGEHLGHAEDQLGRLFQRLLAAAGRAGDVRSDVPPTELARYCLHALAGAGASPSRPAALRLAAVTFSGLRPGGDDPGRQPPR